MGYATAEKIIHSPIASVWNALNDIDHTPDWVTGLEDAKIETPGPYGKNTIYIDYNRLGSAIQTTAWHVTEFEPMARQVHVSKSNVLPSEMTLLLAPVGRATAVTMIVHYRLLPRLGVISRVLEYLLMNHLLTSVLKQNLASLDAYLAVQSVSAVPA